ncbi:MAG: RecQ family ATP-dependent DNA helicase [Victivallales bacterium]|nr:RecQ family ATP-dependent DNA helicase [Victivallales bacterium]
MSVFTEQLKKWFGYESFQGPQENIVERILAGEELCVVMPTGAGKSLCYQLPMLMREGYGLVVSPLISLMRDQVVALQQRQIPAAFVNSSQSTPEQADTLAAARRGVFRLLYVAPERFQAPAFREFLATAPPSLVAVDEAHCVSQWGHDFRPAYQQIWRDVPELANVQLCAYTATATPMVRDDIREQLQRPNMQDVVAGFRRPGLSFQVENIATYQDKFERLDELLKAEQVPTIIYTASRKDAEAIGERFNIHFYHAGLSNARRQESQNYFMQDPCPVLAATNAFGMGIDRPDIRRVIHFGLPASLEAYYQEAGRAGRDGQRATCLLMNCYRDRRTQEFLLDVNNPPCTALLAAERLLRRLASTIGQDQPLVVSSEVLATLVPEFDDPRQAGSALRILEIHNVLLRTTAYVPGEARQIALAHPPHWVQRHFQGMKTQRSMLMNALAEFFERTEVPAWTFLPSQLATLAGLRVDQVLHCLEALKEDQLDVTPLDEQDEAVAATVIPLPEGKETSLDLLSLQKKRQLDERRLEEMCRYATFCRECRQRFILKYFGEEAGDWQCDECDLCENERKHAVEVTDEECFAALEVMRTIREMRISYGFRRIVKVLLGEQDETASDELNANTHFGCLAKYPAAAVREFLDALLRNNFLATVGQYRVLELTRKGILALQSPNLLKTMRLSENLAGQQLARPPFPRRRGSRRRPATLRK